jgi:hypothetical protein
VGGKRETWISGLRSQGWFFFVGSSGSLDEGSCWGHSGYLEALAGNGSPLSFDHAENRVAETRPVNRALRKVYDIALSLEELLPCPSFSAHSPVGLRSRVLATVSYRSYRCLCSLRAAIRRALGK